MELLKNYFLAQKSRKARARSENGPRTTPNFSEAGSIGILFSLEDEENHAALAQFIQWLEGQRKKVRVLTYFEYKRSHPFTFYFDAFTKEDISPMGLIQNAKVSQFLEIEFDFLYCIYTKEQPVLDIILAETKAKCRVGPFDEKRLNLFELMIQPNDAHDGVEAMIGQMKTYSKAIHRNDW